MPFRIIYPGMALIIVALICAPYAASQRDRVIFPIGYDALDYRNTLPVLRDLVIARESSTHDRQGGNDNGFTNKAEYVRRKSRRGTVILDVEGPGCVYSLWYSWPNQPRIPASVERVWARRLKQVKVYFNREDQPYIDLPLRKLAGTSPFTFPLSIHADQSTGGYITYVPLSFEKGIKMEVDGGKMPLFFYHVWYHTYPYGTGVNTYTGKERLSSAILSRLSGPAAPIPPDRLERAIDINLAPGQEREVMAFKSGGTIRSIRMKLPEDDMVLRSVRLLIRWDGESSPSVSAPLSLFYAVENRFREEPAAISENAPLAGPIIGRDKEGFHYLNLPMPFKRKAGFALINDGGNTVKIQEFRVELDRTVFQGLGSSVGYFRTHFNSSYNLEPNRDYMLARLHGRGHIIGTVMAVEDTPETFLEGDERIYTDGSRYPLIMGDATETYFNGSWYFWESAFTCPFHGTPTFRMYKKAIGAKSDITMYRFHLTDLVPFRSEVRFGIQHGPFSNVPGNYRSLVFYYGVSKKGLRRSDVIKMGDYIQLTAHQFRQEESKHKLAERSGFFEGEHDGSWLGELEKPKYTSHMMWNLILTVRGIVSRPKKNSPERKTFFSREDSQPYEFIVKTDPHNRGVMLRRLFDQNIPDQKAAIEVDGKPAGTWFNAGRNRWKRWAEDDFIIGPWLTEGKDRLTIRVIPKSKVFTSCEYQVFSLIFNE